MKAEDTGGSKLVQNPSAILVECAIDSVDSKLHYTAKKLPNALLLKRKQLQ